MSHTFKKKIIVKLFFFFPVFQRCFFKMSIIYIYINIDIFIYIFSKSDVNFFFHSGFETVTYMLQVNYLISVLKGK